MDECSSNHTDAGPLPNCRHPSPISILEPSFSTESCDSSVTTDSYSMEGKSSISFMISDLIVLSPCKHYHSVTMLSIHNYFQEASCVHLFKLRKFLV